MSFRLLAAALLLLAAPAQAGLRAVYDGAEPGRTLVVEVADNGDARIGETGSSDYGLLVGGRFYVIGAARGGRTVADIVELGAAIDTVVTPIFGDTLARSAAAAPTRLPVRPEKLGPATVAGRTGETYVLHGLAAEPAGDGSFRYVISGDVDLKPVGRALEQFMNAAILPGAILTGPGAAALVEQTRAIFALGTPLEAQGRFKLSQVEEADIPAARLAFPVPPSTRAELIAAMKAGN